MTKSEMEYFDWSLVGPLMLFLNQYFNNAIPEYYVLWMCLVSKTFNIELLLVKHHSTGLKESTNPNKEGNNVDCWSLTADACN